MKCPFRLFRAYRVSHFDRSYIMCVKNPEHDKSSDDIKTSVLEKIVRSLKLGQKILTKSFKISILLIKYCMLKSLLST